MIRFPALRASLFLALAGCAPDAPRPAHNAAGSDTLSLAERNGIAAEIAFVAERDGNKEVYAIRPSGTGERRLTRTGLDSYLTSVAPDGAGVLQIEVDEKDPNFRFEQLRFLPLGGGEPSALGPRSPYTRAAAWAPDGKWIVFESARSSFRDLYRMERDGSGVRRLTDNREGNFEPAVSPNGRWVAFGSSRDQNAELYRMRADGSEVTRLTVNPRFDDYTPQWSPDGRMLSFISTRDGDERVFLMGADGTGARRLTRPDTVADIAEQQPQWSPDGKRIAYVVRQRGRASRVRITTVDGGATVEVRGGASGGDSGPQWSPDGRYLVFTSNRDGDHEIYLARGDGSLATRLTRAPEDDWSPRWVAATGARVATSTR